MPVLRIGVCTFRTLNDPLSGELHVLSGSSRRRGARGHGNPAKQKALASSAGSDDGNGPTDGESAHTSAAHAAGQDPGADSAGTVRAEVVRAPKNEYGVTSTRECVPPIARSPKPLPKDTYEFLKEVNEDVQMVEVAKSLLKDEDSRIKQKVFQQLMSIGYAKTLRSKAEKVRTYINDLPQPVRDRRERRYREKRMSNPKAVFAGEIAQIAGVGAVVLGVVLSLHHWGAAAALIGGIAAFFIGRKLRGA